MVDIVSLSYKNVNIAPASIVIIFISLVHLALFVIFLSNIKFAWVKRFVRFKTKRIKLTSLDVPRIFEDFDSHYEDYKEIVVNYKRNKHYMLGHEFINEELEDRENDREIKPYYIMVDFKDTVADSYVKKSMLAASKFHKSGSKIMNSKMHGELFLSFERNSGSDFYLFQNQHLNEVFDKNKDVADKYAIHERNRKRTMTMLGLMAKRNDNRTDTMIMIENMAQMKNKKHIDQDRKLLRFLEVDEHNTAANMKKINPMTVHYTQPVQQTGRVVLNRNSLNLLDSETSHDDTRLVFNGKYNGNLTLEDSVEFKVPKSIKSPSKWL